MRFHLTARTGHPDFLDLPWSQRLEDWEHARLVEVPTGVHRHVVRTVRYDDELYFVKALPERYAEREYRFLRHLADEGVPVVEVVGHVGGRLDDDGQPMQGILITKQLEFALPYRLLFMRWSAQALREPMLDALADLLVRIHLVGFQWGDCSLSNTLFRRDAGQLAAYVVDTETGEHHPNGLTDGQRAWDLELAQERCAGELFDMMAAEMIPQHVDVVEIAEDLLRRYEALWAELTDETVFPMDERYRIHDRLRRINELGFDVGELEVDADPTGDGHRLVMKNLVVEPGRNKRRLRELTGLDAQEGQARRILHDLDSFGLWLREAEGVEYSEPYVARRWLDESFGRVLDRVPRELRGKRDAPEIFTEAVEYWWSQCVESGEDLDLFESTDQYVATVLSRQPDERLPTPTQAEAERIGPDDPDPGAE